MFNERQPLASEEAFVERFGTGPPEELNSGHQLTVIANEVDAATERIVKYLAGFDVPINVLFFRYFADDAREYLARTLQPIHRASSESRQNRSRSSVSVCVRLGVIVDTRRSVSRR